MPSQECYKIHVALTEKQKAVLKGHRRRQQMIDVKKAHLKGVVCEGEFFYISLPGGSCCRHKKWLYGKRPAAQAC
jgi:hypothetical protein